MNRYQFLMSGYLLCVEINVLSNDATYSVAVRVCNRISSMIRFSLQTGRRKLMCKKCEPHSVHVRSVIFCPLVSGSVPLDPLLSASIEEGRDFAQSFPDSATFSAISSISQTLLNSLQSA